MHLSRIGVRNGAQIVQGRPYSTKIDSTLQLLQEQLKKSKADKQNNDKSKFPTLGNRFAGRPGQSNKPNTGGFLGKPITLGASETGAPWRKSGNKKSPSSPAQTDLPWLRNKTKESAAEKPSSWKKPSFTAVKDEGENFPWRQGPKRNENRNNGASQQNRDMPWRRPPPPDPFKPEIPTWDYGTELEKEYMNNLFKNIYEVNQEGRVIFLNEEGDLENGKILNYVDSVPDNHVLGVADVQEQTIGKVAIIKTFDRRTKLKEFSDKKAEEKTKLFGRARKNKRDASLKNIKVSWEISQSDLDNQKNNEITGHLKKGYKLLLVIGQKDDIGVNKFFDRLNKRAKENEEEQDEELDEDDFGFEPTVMAKNLNSYEVVRRTKVLDQVKTMLEGLSTYTINGDIRSRILINAEPLVTEDKKVDEKKKLKDQKKLERQLKEKLRQEKKKAKEESKKNQVSSLLQTE